MKKLKLLLIAGISIFGLVSCGIVGRQTGLGDPREQSKFKDNFSIGTIIESYEDLLIEGPRTLNGMEAGSRELFVQRHEYITIQIDQDNITALMNSIQSDLEESLSISGASIVGTGGADAQADPIAYFSYSYREGPFYGVVNIWGVRGESNELILISQITESLNIGGN